MNILHISSILPAPVQRKKTENDILIRIAEEYQEKYPTTRHYFLLIIPYSNGFLSLFKKRWQEYNDLLKKGNYKYEKFVIEVIGVPAFKNDSALRKELCGLGYVFNRNKIQKMMSEIKPDIVHAHNFKADIEIAKLLKKKFEINYVVTARGIEHNTFKKLRKDKYAPKKILSINFQNYVKSKDNLSIPVYFIPHAVDEDFYIEPTYANSNVKLISVCRLIKLKNIDKVLTALSKLNVSFVYDIYGNGPEENNLKMQVMDLNLQSQVNFKGWVSHDEIKTNMSAYDLFLQPSYPETLGRVYFEAMASGVSVLASKHTGVDGIISEGIEGYLVNHNSIESIYTAIKDYFEMSEKGRIEMKKAAYRKMLDYKWDSVLKKYHEFYKSKD